jgi:hypothetical protein
VQTDQHQSDCAQHTRKRRQWGIYLQFEESLATP